MKKNVNVTVEVANSVNESKKTKGYKVANSVNATILQPTKKETKKTFESYICSKEEISVSKFFRLFQSFKVDSPKAYSEFISAYNLDLNTDYSFDWFKANCPKDEKGMFAKWTKVTEKTKANEKEEYNRQTEKGIIYTLVAYNTLKADYTQFIQIFLNVVSEIKRIQREKAKAEREAEKAKAKAEREAKQAEKNLKTVNEIFQEIFDISKEFSLPFDTAMNVFAKTKKMNISAELKSLLLAKVA